MIEVVDGIKELLLSKYIARIALSHIYNYIIYIFVLSTQTSVITQSRRVNKVTLSYFEMKAEVYASIGFQVVMSVPENKQKIRKFWNGNVYLFSKNLLFRFFI